MAQDTHIYRNGQGNRGRSVSATEETTPYCLETPYGYQLDLDFLKYVDDIQNGSTIKRLRRKPLRATNSRAEAQSGTTASQSWTSLESLSSASSDDTRLSQSAMATGNRGRPPLPPPHGASTTTPSSQEGSSVSLKPQEGKPAPAVRSLTTPRFNPLVEKTLVETRRRLEQEKTLSTTPDQPHPEPHSRRRLASFGGVGSSGSLSAFTGWSSYNQNNSGNVNKPHAEGELSLSLHHGSSLGSGGSLRHSPQSSGRDTPVTVLSPLHLQHVRDQMVVAIQRLKELEEQVRSIPVLQVKISVLQEEKRQLVSRMKNQNQEELSDVFRKRAHSTGSAGRFRVVKGSEPLGKPEDGLENKAEHNSASSGLKEFQQLTAEMEALERTIKGGRLQARHGLNLNTLRSNCRAHKSVAIGIDEDLDAILDARSSKQHRDVTVETKPTDTRCVAPDVTEAHLVVTADKGSELDAQQRIIEALEERVCQLEAEVKESTLQTEMGRLKLELQAAGARNKADKGSTARPSTHSTSTATEATPKAQTRSLGVGNHTEVQDASAGGRLEVEGWGCSVGVSCRPELRSVSSGPELPMTWWVVRERVETQDQCVGRQVVMVTQGVGTGVRVCEVGVNTDLTMESLAAVKRWGMAECQLVSVGSGDCTVDDVTTSAVKEVGMATDPPVRGVDSGVMVSPQTVSQRTNTSPTLGSVSRFTNTSRSFNTNSSTNTVLNTQEKHTNTAHTVTRNIAVGNGRLLEIIQVVAKTRSVGVGTTMPWGGNAEQPTQTNASIAKATTRDAGVGMTNVNNNFLVGLKTRNIACGPSCLPDPTKTRSIGIGVGEGRIRDLAGPPSLTQTSHSPQAQGQSQLEPGLDHYIEKMQCLLREQQGLLTESYSELGEVFIQPESDTTTLITSLINSAMTQGGTDRPIPSQSTDCVQSQSIAGPGQFTNTSPQRNTERSGVSQCVTKESEVKQKILRIEHQTSSALHGQPTNANMLRSIMKKQDGDRGYTGTRKSLKFVGVTTGCESMSTSEPSSSEEEEKNENWRWREVCGLQDRSQNKGLANRECSGYGRTEIQERFQLSEKMLSACHALKTHLSDDQILSSRELRSCLNMLQHEWFRVSSQKSAAPVVVGNYLMAFRSVSPAVLRHIANMADGNGNTALHYSVSHSNFTVVKRMLLADVCNVNQQNKAGYTPIMLAALAAVEAPEDMEVVEELFTKGDVNAKASQAGQTALMLAVSHGRMDMVRALLAKGAEVNLQDDEGSTALMCASEHGHAEIVRLLLAKPGCNATLSDSDESTALSIALEAGHKDIAVLLYAHVNFSKGQAGGTPRLGRNTPPSFAGRAIFE